MFVYNQISRIKFDALPDFLLSWKFGDSAIIYNRYYY